MYALSLNRLSLALELLYGALVVTAASIFRRLCPEWINRITATLIHGTSLPLLAVMALVTGSILFPDDKPLRKRQQLYCHLSAMAALGFLLLIPLNISMGVVEHQSSPLRLRSLDDSERQLAAYRQAAATSSNPAAPQGNQTAPGAPRLDAAALALPLPEIQEGLLLTFDQTDSQIRSRRQIFANATDLTSWLTVIACILATCLTLTFSFAAFARPTFMAPPAVIRIQQNLARLLLRSRRRRSGRRSKKRSQKSTSGVTNSPRMARRNPLESFFTGLRRFIRRMSRRMKRLNTRRLLHSLDCRRLFGRRKKLRRRRRRRSFNQEVK